MPELLRPGPPRSLVDRARCALVAVSPARAATAVGTVLLAASLGWWLVRPQRPPVEADLPRATSSVQVSASPTGSLDTVPPSAAPVTVVVQVAGAVAHPGVYRLVGGSRVVDLVDAAGGAAAEADLEQVALAVVLADGQRVQVPRRGEQLPAAAVGLGAPAAPSVPAGPVDLNQASAEALDALPGIGPTTAQAIVAHREQRGPYRSVEDLLDVKGIGPAKLDGLRGLVAV